MDLRKAYDLLGLEDRDTFAAKARGGRRMGATTWMTVQAALFMLDYTNLRVGSPYVVLVCRDLYEAERAAQMCTKHLFKLSPTGTVLVRNPLGKNPQTRFSDVTTPLTKGRIYWESERTYPRFRGPSNIEVFRDIDFQMALSRKMKNPFHQVAKIIPQSNGSYAAYDSFGEFLFETTAEGAKSMVDADPYRIFFSEEEG